MRPRKDITGQVFGRLTVIEEVDPIIYYSKTQKLIYRKYKCQCLCGVTKIISMSSLVSGGTVSCGCYNKERLSEANTTHGCSYTNANSLERSTYYSWKSMKSRCNNPNNPKYNDYGGRGITICNRWINHNSGFSNFVEDMGIKDSVNLTIDRIDPEKGYYKENCRWLNRKGQNDNKRNSIRYSYNGKKYTITELAKLINMKRYTLRARLYYKGWSVERAVNTPVRKRTIKNK